MDSGSCSPCLRQAPVSRGPQDGWPSCNLTTGGGPDPRGPPPGFSSSRRLPSSSPIHPAHPHDSAAAPEINRGRGQGATIEEPAPSSCGLSCRGARAPASREGWREASWLRRCLTVSGPSRPWSALLTTHKPTLPPGCPVFASALSAICFSPSPWFLANSQIPWSLLGSFLFYSPHMSQRTSAHLDGETEAQGDVPCQCYRESLDTSWVPQNTGQGAGSRSP